MRCFSFMKFLLQFCRNVLACFWAKKEINPEFWGFPIETLILDVVVKKYDIFHRKFEIAVLFWQNMAVNR